MPIAFSEEASVASTLRDGTLFRADLSQEEARFESPAWHDHAFARSRTRGEDRQGTLWRLGGSKKTDSPQGSEACVTLRILSLTSCNRWLTFAKTRLRRRCNGGSTFDRHWKRRQQRRERVAGGKTNSHRIARCAESPFDRTLEDSRRATPALSRPIRRLMRENP